jgi:hypothetical protein
MPKKLVKSKSVKIPGAETTSQRELNPEESSAQKKYKTRGVAEAIKKNQAQLLRDQMK